MASKARDLSNFISVATVDASEIASNAVTADKIADVAVTHAKLHTDMNLSGKTLTFATNQISGNAIDGGVISNFTSTGIDDNSSATAVTILSDGNVGIGATNPGVSRLYLQDTHTTAVTNAATMLANTTLTINGNSGQGSDVIRMGPMGTAGRQFIDVSNSAGNAAYDLLLNPISGGKVGIGTTTPASRLDVLNGTANTQVASFSGADAGGGLKILTASTTRNDDTVILKASDAFGEIAFTSDNTEVMRITKDNNVGIGTTSPSDKLTVTGGHINLPTANSYIKGSGHNIVQVDNTRTYFYGGTDGLQFRTADNSAALWHITNGGLLKREGGSAVDNSNTNFNINLPANGGITMGSAYTFSNIYGDAGGNLFLKANAYPANTGAATSITLQTGNAGGGTESPVTVVGGNISFVNGKGIHFGASTGGIRGTSTNTVLDDYEEGTYTPTYTNGSVSYSIQVGNYVKIGTFCRVWFDFTITGASGQSGTPTITLPFTSKSGDHDMGQFTPWEIHNSFTNSRHATQWITTNSSYMMMYTWAGDSNTGHAAWNLNTTGRISGSVCYTTA